jgi:hypothetical protein
MINWINLKDRKPEPPISKDDINFKLDILLIDDNQNLMPASWCFRDFLNPITFTLNDMMSEYCNEINFDHWTHWIQVNLPEDKA